MSSDALSYGRTNSNYSIPAKRRRFPLFVVVGVVLGMVGFIMFVILPGLCGTREGSRRLRCASNMKQIGLGAIMYANDHGGHLPDDLDTILKTQDLSPEAFVCPSSNDTAATGPTTQAVIDDMNAQGHLSYIYTGKGLTTQAAADVVILYERRTTTRAMTWRHQRILRQTGRRHERPLRRRPRRMACGRRRGGRAKTGRGRGVPGEAAGDPTRTADDTGTIRTVICGHNPDRFSGQLLRPYHTIVHRIDDAIVRDGKLVLTNLPFAEGQHVRVVLAESEPVPARTTITEVRRLLRGGVEQLDDPTEPMIPMPYFDRRRAEIGRYAARWGIHR